MNKLEKEISELTKPHNIITLSNDDEIFDFNSNILKLGEWVPNLISVSWEPWAWKWRYLKYIWDIIKSEEWKKILKTKKYDWTEDPFINLDWWFIFQTWKTYEIWWKRVAVVLVKLDFFFKNIWFLDYEKQQKIRYSLSPWWMLYDLKSFKDLYWDEEHIIRFIKKVIENKEGFIEKDLYWKSPNERKEGKKKTWLKVNKRDKDTELLILLDWINSDRICDLLNWINLTLNIKRIIIKPEPGECLDNIILRDVFWRNPKWNQLRDLDDILPLRINEHYLSSNAFTFESLKKDPGIIDVIEFTRHNVGGILLPKYVNDIVIPSLKKHLELTLTSLSERQQLEEVKVRIQHTEDYVNFVIDSFQNHY